MKNQLLLIAFALILVVTEGCQKKTVTSNEPKHYAAGVIFDVEKYLFNKTRMKTILLFSVFFVLSFVLFAQTEIQPKKQKPERNNHFEISPKFEQRQSDSLAFSDTLPGMPEVFVHRKIATSNEDKFDSYRMPVARPGDNRQFNMPVYVPDSSVHYYIKQAMPVQPLPKKK